MANKKPLYPHVPRRTVVHDRYTIDCSYCGFIVSAKGLNSAIEAGRRLSSRHAQPGEKITIFDVMAKKGACDTWDINGVCLHKKE